MIRSDVVGSLLRPGAEGRPRALGARRALPPPRSSGSRTARWTRRCASRRRPGSTWSPTASCGATPSSATSSTRSTASTSWAAGPSRSTTSRASELVFKRPVVVEKLRWRRSMCAEEFAYLRARADAARQGHADQHAAGRRLLRSREVRRAPTRRATPTWPTSWTSRGARSTSWCALGCTYIQIDAPQYAALLDPELREGYRKRGSDPDRLDRRLHRDGQRGDRRPPGRHLRPAHLPRQQPVHVLRQRRLRADRARLHAGAASSASCSSTTTSARAASSRCARCRTIASWCSGLVTTKKPAPGVGRRAARAASTRPPRLHPARAAGAQPAVRLRLDHGGQPDLAGGAAGQAPPRGRDRPVRLEPTGDPRRTRDENPGSARARAARPGSARRLGPVRQDRRGGSRSPAATAPAAPRSAPATRSRSSRSTRPAA